MMVRMDVEPTIRVRIFRGDAISLCLGNTGDDDFPEWCELELSLDKARELRRLLTRELRHAAKTDDEGTETT